jgi:uncharacterized protein
MKRGMALTCLGVAAVAGVIATIAVPRVRSALIGALPPTWNIALSAWRYGIRADHDVVIAMPDGVRSSASLYLPRAASGPLPTVLVRLPYDRLRYGEGRNSALFFARHGYAALVQDLRGTGSSGGELLPWRDAASDGVATLDWIAGQPWSNGKVGTFGCSALGETQLVLAARNHPAHRAMIASGAGGAVGSALGRGGYFGVFEGGVFQLASAFGWFAGSGAKRPDAPPAAAFDIAKHLRELPVSALVSRVRPAPNGYADFLATPLADPTWAGWGYLTDADRIDVPALVINTWGDQTVGDALAWAEYTRLNQGQAGAGRQKVVIAPGNHCQHEESAESDARFGELELGDAAQPWQDWYLRWFDQWLSGRGDGLAQLSAYTYFMLVENRWRSASQWPPREAREERWYLGSHGRANSIGGTGFVGRQPKRDAPSDGLRYDPMDPVPSRGGPVCCTGDAHERAGPVDQADVEARDDVLVYSSEPLEADLRIAGPLKLHLTFSTDVPDTDLVARLAHVWPDGRSTNIQEGALRLRYRQGLAPAPALKAGAQYEVEVDLRSVGYMVPRGHRLRVHVTSSSFPRLERNLNGPGPNADATASHVASSRVHYGNAGDGSYVVLPVLAASTRDP